MSADSLPISPICLAVAELPVGMMKREPPMTENGRSRTAPPLGRRAGLARLYAMRDVSGRFGRAAGFSALGQVELFLPASDDGLGGDEGQLRQGIGGEIA